MPNISSEAQAQYHVDLDNPPADFALPGDIWAFSGNGPYSKLIKLTTCSFAQLLTGETPSHIAISATYNSVLARAWANKTQLTIGHQQYDTQCLLFESTELVDLPCCITGLWHTGVQAHPVIERIKRYNGSVWRYRLEPDWTLNETQSQALSIFLLNQLGEPYDIYDAYMSATIRLRLMRCFRHDLRKRFCSDLVLDAYRHCDLISKNFSPKAYNPARAIRDLAYWGFIQDLCGCQGQLNKCQTPCESILVKSFQ